MEMSKTENDRPFLLGVNYWPQKKAMYWWSDFNEDEVKSDFERIRSLGMTQVRIFLLWHDWQPVPDQVNPACMNHFEKVCNSAEANELNLNVTFFTGHMSGPNWIPNWMLLPEQPKPNEVRQVVSGRKIVNCGYRNPYMDRTVIEAEKLLIRTVVSNFYDHPGIGVWNLGNEPDLVAFPDDGESGTRWVKELSMLIKNIDPSHPVTLGLHSANLLEDNGFQVSQVFRELDRAVMHGYPMYIDWVDDPLDSGFVPFTCALTASLCGKPVLYEEFGGCTLPENAPSTFWKWEGYGRHYNQFMASEEDLAGYVERVLHGLVAVGALGALIWCYADYDPSLYDRPPCDQSLHERHFGLIRSDGSLKPHAHVIRQFAETKPTVRPLVQPFHPPLIPDEYYRQPLEYCRRLYAEFSEMKSQW